MQKSKYHTGLVSKSLWFVEFKEYMKLSRGGLSHQEIKALQDENNIFSTRSQNNSKRILGAISERTDALPANIKDLFFDLDLSNQKYVAFLAAMLVDRMFAEFVYTTYRKEIMIGAREYTNSVARIFIYDMIHQHDELSHIVDTTVNRLASSYTTHLLEADLLTKKDGKTYYKKIILDPRLRGAMVEAELNTYLKAMEGEA